MFKQVFMAHDGSLGSDWVNKYAMRLAGRCVGKEITWVNVVEKDGNQRISDQKIVALEKEAEKLGVKGHFLKMEGEPISVLSEVMGKNKDALLVTGTRNRETPRGILQGSVSAGLLKKGGFPILAIRVVHPGILGSPRDLLWGLSGNPMTVERGIPLLKLFAPNLKNLHLLKIVGVPKTKYRHLTHDMVVDLEEQGESVLKKELGEITTHCPELKSLTDIRAIVSNDWAKEILIVANKIKTELLLIGASERTISQKIFTGNPLEEILRKSNCDVAVFRGI